MAIKNKDNQYIKINTEKTYADESGLHISFEFYRNQEMRELIKTRQPAIKQFKESANKLIENYEEALYEFIVNSGEIIGEDMFDEDGFFKDEYASFKSKQMNIANLKEDAEYIFRHCYEGGDKGDVNKIKDIKTMKILGFKERWFVTPLQNGADSGTLRINNMAKTRNTAELYGQLKKLISDTADC